MWFGHSHFGKKGFWLAMSGRFLLYFRAYEEDPQDKEEEQESKDG